MPNKFKLVKPADDYHDITLKYGAQFKVIGVLEIIFGIVMSTIEIISFILDHDKYYIYLTEPAIWCGIIFCATGWIALCSWKIVTKRNVIAGIILSVVSIMLCICWLSWYEVFMMRLFARRENEAHLLAFHIVIFLCTVGQFLAGGFHVLFGVRSLRHLA